MGSDQQASHPNSARDAYDAFAPAYDEYNAQNDYEVWLGEVLLPEIEQHGLSVGRVLDIGCGTGRAFEPLIRRGWMVHGCDLSEGMLREAHRKYPDVSLRAADAAHLPAYDCDFDLILALNDVVNYLTEDGDLEKAFVGMKKNLGPHGLICFDVNSLGLMRHNFAGDGMTRGEWTWRGLSEGVEPGGIYEAIISSPRIKSSVHRQRHWTEDEVGGALEAAGLTCLARLGQREEPGRIVLSESADEERDAKVIYIGGHRGG